MKKQVHIFISGVVQGVGFRQFVKYHAKRLGVTGWVQNIADGRVEGLLSGEEEPLRRLIGLCKKGPPLSRVNHVELQWQKQIDLFDSFHVIK